MSATFIVFNMSLFNVGDDDDLELMAIPSLE